MGSIASRGRKYKKKKSALVVVSGSGDIFHGAGNLPGVDVVKAEHLGVEQLAPGTHGGRLTVYTKSAIDKIVERFK